MIIIELLTEVIDRSNHWLPGEQPTVGKEYGMSLILQLKAKYIGEGCGCPR